MSKDVRYVNVDEAKTRKCGFCAAGIGEPCVTSNGTVMQTTHFERDQPCGCQGSDERWCALHGDGDDDYYGRRWA